MLENVYEGLNARKCKGRSNKKSSKNKVHLFFNFASGRTLPTQSTGPQNSSQSIFSQSVFSQSLFSQSVYPKVNFSKMYFFEFFFPKCIYPKCISAKYTQLACLLSFASLFMKNHDVDEFIASAFEIFQ